jgi:hypothetical protein
MDPKPMSDDEALDYIKKRYGSYDAYRAQRFDNAPDYDAGRAWVFASAAEVMAKRENLTIEEYFAKHPDEYRLYREANLVKSGTRRK